jgi:hypothetical protein
MFPAPWRGEAKLKLYFNNNYNTVITKIIIIVILRDDMTATLTLSGYRSSLCSGALDPPHLSLTAKPSLSGLPAT